MTQQNLVPSLIDLKQLSQLKEGTQKMNLIKEGTYTGKVVDHAITETKDGNPQAYIRFEFEADGTTRELPWYGSFKEKALEHTIKALVVCGLEGSNPAGPLSIGKEVSIVVKIDKDNNGNDRNVIRWVNRLGGVNPVDPVKARSSLEKYSALVIATKQNMGVKDSGGSSDIHF
jgi:hypothetical protein